MTIDGTCSLRGLLSTNQSMGNAGCCPSMQPCPMLLRVHLFAVSSIHAPQASRVSRQTEPSEGSIHDKKKSIKRGHILVCRCEDARNQKKKKYNQQEYGEVAVIIIMVATVRRGNRMKRAISQQKREMANQIMY